MDKSMKSSSTSLASSDVQPKSKQVAEIVGSTLSSDSENDDMEVSCDVCKTTFSGSVPFEQHLNGHRHNKMLKKLEMKKRYARRVNKSEEKDQNNSGDDHKDAEDDLEDETIPEILCELCNKKCLGYFCYQQHLKGRKHAKKLKQIKLIEKLNLGQKSTQYGKLSDKKGASMDSSLYDTLPHLKPYAYCEICNKKFTGPEAYQQHTESDVHKKTVINQQLAKKIQNTVDVHSKDNTLDDERDALQKDSNDIDDVPEMKPFAECYECKKKFTGPVPYQQHMISDSHKKMLDKRQLIEKLKISTKSSEPEDHSLTCKDCNKSFSGPEPFQQHLNSESHDKQKRKGELRKSLLSEYPEMAKENFTDIEYEALLKENGNRVDRDSNQFLPNDREYLMCEVCHKCFSGPENARDHFVSKRHLKAIIEKEKLRLLRQLSRDISLPHSSKSSMKESSANGKGWKEGSSANGEASHNNFVKAEKVNPKHLNQGKEMDSMKVSSKPQNQATRKNGPLVKEIPSADLFRQTKDKSRSRTSNSLSSDAEDFEVIS